MSGLEQLAAKARTGDAASLESLVAAIQGRVYNLALRMLWHPEDAEDAAQEILIRVVTHLSGFRNESTFATWVYRIAANHLLTTRKRRAEAAEWTFERFAEDLDHGLGAAREDPEACMLIEEIKIGCTHGMLLCLDREHRLAYILGEICELDSADAGFALEISPSAFRKRLERSRSRLETFMRAKCGLLNGAAPCRCNRRVDSAIAQDRVDPLNLQLAREVKTIEQFRDAAQVFRSNPAYSASSALGEKLRALIAQRGL
jgi:RNA polymerase sigma factor (sigma-70 family)